MGDPIGRIISFFCGVGILWVLSLFGFFSDPIGTFFASDADPEDWGSKIATPIMILLFLYIALQCFLMALYEEKPRGV